MLYSLQFILQLSHSLPQIPILFSLLSHICSKFFIFFINWIILILIISILLTFLTQSIFKIRLSLLWTILLLLVLSLRSIFYSCSTQLTRIAVRTMMLNLLCRLECHWLLLGSKYGTLSRLNIEKTRSRLSRVILRILICWWWDSLWRNYIILLLILLFTRWLHGICTHFILNVV